MNAYICFPTPKSSGDTPPDWFGRLLQRVLPSGNPDFQHSYNDVVMWHVEIDASTGKPLREVGLDAQHRVLAISPWCKNHGFIVDSPVTFDPTSYQQISAERFEQEWASFDPTNLKI